MSNLTGFTTGEVDLSYVFQPYTSGTKPANTGFRLSTGIDLKDVFQPYSSGTKVAITGFKKNGMDLSDMFAAMTPYLQTGGTVTTYGSAVKITYNATNATGTGLTQSVGSFSIKDASKISGLRILLVSGGGGGGVGVANNSSASGGGGGHVRSLPCKDYVNNTALNITVGLGGAGAYCSSNGGIPPTLTGTFATRGGNSAFNVTSGTITYIISNVDYIGAAPHTYTLVNNGTSHGGNTNPTIFSAGAGSGGGGGAATSNGAFGSTYLGGDGTMTGVGQGGDCALSRWNTNVSDSYASYLACAGGGGGGPSGAKPAQNSILLRLEPAGMYAYTNISPGGNGTSLTNAEFSNETITYGGGGGWAVDPRFLQITNALVSAGGSGGGGAGVRTTSNNQQGTSGTNSLGGGGGGIASNVSSGAFNARGGHGGNGTVVIIFTLLQSGQTIIYSDNLNSITNQTFNGAQYQSGLVVAFGGDIAGWTKSGTSTAHIVDTSNQVGGTNSRNYVIMFYQDNVITQTSSVTNSNISGVQYVVSFNAGPAVYQDQNQATTSADGIVFEILRSTNTVLTSFTYSPGAWAGYPILTSASFNYTGDGTGDIRIRIKTNNSSSGRFGGCVDDVVITRIG